MDVQDGFIVGIFNYCDRWCEACGLTSRCRCFALDAEMHARLDPSLRALVDAPLRPEDRREPPQWLQDIIEEAEASAARGDLVDEVVRPSADDHRAIERRASAYAHAADVWLTARGANDADDPGDPFAIIGWYATFIPAKVRRATVGLANDDGEFDGPTDYDGSAKAAILGIERSHAAWTAIIASGAVAEAEAKPFLDELTWLVAALDEAFPKARAFVRPGLDEPEAVARLEAEERAFD